MKTAKPTMANGSKKGAFAVECQGFDLLGKTARRKAAKENVLYNCKGGTNVVYVSFPRIASSSLIQPKGSYSSLLKTANEICRLSRLSSRSLAQ